MRFLFVSKEFWIFLRNLIERDEEEKEEEKNE